MAQARFERQFPEPLRCWITHAPRRWPAPEGWWLDLARERIVLFGGSDSGSEVYGDTWEWDGEAWEKVTGAGIAGGA